jgi:hypothetical protein
LPSRSIRSDGGKARVAAASNLASSREIPVDFGGLTARFAEFTERIIGPVATL